MVINAGHMEFVKNLLFKIHENTNNIQSNCSAMLAPPHSPGVNSQKDYHQSLNSCVFTGSILKHLAVKVLRHPQEYEEDAMKFWLRLTSKGCVIMLRSSSIVTELVRLAILLRNRTGLISTCKESSSLVGI